MPTHLIVPLDAAATSFCYYENERYEGGPSELLPIEVLAGIVDWAHRQELAVNFVYGCTPVRQDYADLIESIPHIKVLPLPLQGAYRHAMIVINPGEVARLFELSASEDLNVILRLARRQLADFARIIGALIGKCRRINVILLGMEQYTDADFQIYEAQLRKLLPLLVEEYQSGRSPELSCLTDRIFLRQMRNCEAGLTHLTVSPEGKFFLCPAFYYTDAGDSVGSLADGIILRDAELLTLERAPICSLCDAFHCKRCPWLNKRLTGEINTPSRQECVLSHLEREACRELVERLRGLDGFRHIPRISGIDYLDPFELIQRADGYVTPPVAAGADVAVVPKSETVRPSEQISSKNKVLRRGRAPEHSSVLDQEPLRADVPDARKTDSPSPAAAGEGRGEGIRGSSAVDPPSAPDTTRKRVGQVSAGERDEIRRLYERRNGLAELARSLTGMSREDLSGSALYERLVTDTSEVATRFQNWWDEKGVQHGWESAPNGQWQIDFDTCEIYLVASGEQTADSG